MDVVVMDDREEFANTDRFYMARQVICDDFENLHQYLLPNALVLSRLQRRHADQYHHPRRLSCRF